MHSFADIAQRSLSIVLSSLNESHQLTVTALQTSGATIHVKNLQAVQLAKAAIAVGVFSLFESFLQSTLLSKNGLDGARKILKNYNTSGSNMHFEDYIMAINVLKHGRGRSYDALVARASEVPFRVRAPDISYFEEGDVSEIHTLIDVDENFLRGLVCTMDGVACLIESHLTPDPDDS